MLKHRVITAAVLIFVLALCLSSSSAWPFMAFIALAVVVGAWEWARLTAAPMFIKVALPAVTAISIGYLAYTDQMSWPSTIWQVAGAAWVIGSLWLLRVGSAGWQRIPRAVQWMAGWVVMVLVWVAIVLSYRLGLVFLFSVFSLVWVADMAAYFGGRAFGKRKLAPSISPGKSWEGVYSGVAGVFIGAGIWIALDHSGTSLFSQLWQRHSAITAAGLVMGLVAMSVIGDLVESLIKRAAGAKDSSQLLPGHGGVLDRIDALLPVFPIVMAVLSL